MAACGLCLVHTVNLSYVNIVVLIPMFTFACVMALRFLLNCCSFFCKLWHYCHGHVPLNLMPGYVWFCVYMQYSYVDLGDKATKAELKNIPLEFQLSRSCKMSERAEASRENSRLFFCEQCLLMQSGLSCNFIVCFEFSAKGTSSRQVPIAYTTSELRKTNFYPDSMFLCLTWWSLYTLYNVSLTINGADWAYSCDVAME